jgi:hypothetical protein
VAPASAAHVLGSCLMSLGLVLTGCAELADHGVAVSSSAFTDYTRTKYADGAPKPESYVFMQGHYFPGAMVDTSLQKLPFRQVAEILAPELAKRAYFPATDVKSANLILVVHWGVTSPYERFDKLLARDPTSLAGQLGADANTGVDYHPHTFAAGNEEAMVSDQAVADAFVGISSSDAMTAAEQEAELRTDQLGAQYNRANAMALLGYGRHLRKTENQPFATAEEATLRSDLDSERYFVVIQAYDLRQMTNRRPKLAWTLHLNMRCAGNNFTEAVAMMGDVAVNYFGRDMDRVNTVLPRERRATVTVGEITIIGEVR